MKYNQHTQPVRVLTVLLLWRPAVWNTRVLRSHDNHINDLAYMMWCSHPACLAHRGCSRHPHLIHQQIWGLEKTFQMTNIGGFKKKKVFLLCHSIVWGTRYICDTWLSVSTTDTACLMFNLIVHSNTHHFCSVETCLNPDNSIILCCILLHCTQHTRAWPIYPLANQNRQTNTNKISIGSHVWNLLQKNDAEKRMCIYVFLL